MKEEQQSLYSCNICNDSTWILDKNGKILDRCKCYEIRRVKEQWKNSGLNIDDLDKNFKTYEPWNEVTKNLKASTTNYYLRFKDIKNTRNNSILMCGQPGVGKTHLALALANNFIKNDKRKVIYMPYRDVITSLKQNMINEDNYKNTINKYQTAEVLLVDDLFKGKITESDINIMFEIINHRYINKLPVIISTEYLINDILRIDEAIGSRIFEMSKDFIVEIKGKENNYRLRINNV